MLKFGFIKFKVLDNSMQNEEICFLDELIIEGLTIEGNKFRPSDWVDRLCGTLAGFNQRKVSYSPYLRPLIYNNINCIALKKSLKIDSPEIFNFIMQFAKDNSLIVIDCASFKEKLK